MLPPAGVVVLVTAINVVAAYMMLQLTIEVMPVEAQELSGLIYGSAVVGGLVGRS